MFTLGPKSERAATCLWLPLLLLLFGCSGSVDGEALQNRTAAGTSGNGGLAGSATGGAGGRAGASSVGGAAGGGQCAVGMSACTNGCVDTRSDSANCGTCGNACGTGFSCQSGSCVVACATGQAACAGVCKTIVSDPTNCGECGRACGAGQFCSAGACVAQCPFQACVTASGNECADLTTNPSHCGACGTACPPGQSCVGGACALSCAGGQTACSGQCVDTQSSAAHCGACGTACAAGTPCVGGGCGCPSGQTLCQGACVDLTNTAAHCGACGTTCAVGQVCEGGSCRAGCSSGLTACGGSCADLQSDEAHCGTCATVCSPAQSCVGGSCVCPNGGSACGGSCTDLGTDESNCGTCGETCGAAQTCIGGDCSCPNGLTSCSGTCVDAQTSEDHCGTCGNACATGSSCVSGVCSCPSGQTSCGGTCVDVEASDAHCGGCGAACAMGQACLLGVCTGAGGVGADGCAGGLARNVALSRVDVFQAVHVTIMNAGSEVAAAARKTDLIQGREAIFRVFATPGSGWAAREISARVTIVNGANSNEYFAKKTLSGASSEGNIQSTFQITVPADQLQADSRYHVELVECGTPPSGSATTPRFPAADEAALGARRTGPLKVRVIPIRSNMRVPDTSEAALAPYKALLDAMYPATAVELSVGDEVSGSYPVDWNGTLDLVRSKRQTDRPAADIYYYGLIAPNATFREFCGNGCTAGIGFVPSVQDASRRVSLGIGFADEQSHSTMAHEIGHNHGREHAPCVPRGGQISGVDAAYPYADGNIGGWGYDRRTQMFINPEEVTDILGYCNNKWISDYTYDGLVNRMATVNGAQRVKIDPDSLGRFRVLLLDAFGPRWGVPIDEPTVPGGAPEVAEILNGSGDVVDHTIVYRTEVSDIDAWSILVPEPAPGQHSVRISGAAPLAFAAPSP